MSSSDFDWWNDKKKTIDSRQKSPYCKKRDVWLCSIGKNVGRELSSFNTSFTRPVLVFKVFSKDMFWGLPITSSDPRGKKKDSQFYYEFSNVPDLEDGFVALSQLRVFDNKRLVRKMARINKETMQEIEKKLKTLC